MAREQIPQAHFDALVRMFQAFAPFECERWTYLLGKEPHKWSKITPIKIWPLPSAFDSLPDIPLWEMLSLPSLAPHADGEALVLRCGHSRNPGTAVVPLRDVFLSGRRSHEIVFEGFVSVVPGRLALGFNHEGGVCVFGA
jgi:hypothetical protein